MDADDTKSLINNIMAGTKAICVGIIDFIPPINAAGWPFIAIAAIASVIFATFSTFLFWIGALLTLFCCYFFRDPVRTVPDRGNLIIAPADGVISKIEECDLPSELDVDGADGKVTRISIFLNVFNVHVQRVPVSGTVREVVYRPGKFLNASLDKASEHNERSSALIELEDGRSLAVVQIAGLIARRIINNLKENDAVQIGARYGLIRFGSRVDIYLPKGVSPLVSIGQTTVGGETVLADLKSKEKARSGQKI